MRMAGSIGVSLRNEVIVVNSPQEDLFVPLRGRGPIAVPERFRVLLEAINKKLKLLRLGSMEALMDRIENLLCLVDQGQRGSNGSVLPSLTNRRLSRSANTLSICGNAFGKLHQCRGRLLIGKRHDGLIDWQAASLDRSATTRRDTEDVCVLAGTRIRKQEAGEIAVHTRIKKFPPSSRHGIGCIAQNMKQSNVVEAKSRNKRILHEYFAGGWKLISLIVIADDRQDLLGAGINSDAIWHLKAALLAFPFMLEASNV